LVHDILDGIASSLRFRVYPRSKVEYSPNPGFTRGAMDVERQTADILRDWREAERLAEEAADPATRLERRAQADQLRDEYLKRLDDLDTVASELRRFPPTPKPPDGEHSGEGEAFA
jgi:hypothetical protein